MANTLHGPYSPTTWTSGVSALSSAHMNNLETEAGVALASFNPDLIGAGFVLSGVTCAKDGTIANQLDVASGEAYLVQSDGTLARCDVASTTFATSVISTTYYLDLNPDGSWSWGTAHSGVTNRMFIASATTDGSGNILVVSDLRTVWPSLLPNAAGVRLPLIGSVNGQNAVGSFGAPLIVAQALSVAGAGVGLTTILSYTVPATGLYRINCAFRVNTNGNVTVEATYTDSFASIARTAYFQALADSAVAYIETNGGSTVHSAYVTSALTLSAQAATTLACLYGNSAGASGDLVTFLIERLA